MTFFEQQDQARKRSWLLIGFLCVAVMLLVFVTSAFIHLLLVWYDFWPFMPVSTSPTNLHGSFFGLVFTSPLTGLIAIGVVTVVLGGSLFKMWQLSKGGGSSVAVGLGGYVVD